MHAIEIDHLTYSYPGAAHPALQDITVCVEQGDFLAIVGNNGCGKSTFCKALNGLIPQFISGDFSGRVLACGLDTRTSDVGALARKVGYVYQDFENQIIRPTVLDDASYACQNYAMPDYKERGMAALEQCGLRGRESDFIWQLSGRADPSAGAGGGSVSAARRPDPGRAHRPAGPGPRRPHLWGAAGAERAVRQDHHRHRAPHRVHCRLLQARHAAERGPGAVDAAHRRGSAAGGRTAKLQYFPAAGDPCGLADAPGGQPDRAAPAGDHLRGQGSVCPPGKPGTRPAACRPCAGGDGGLLPGRFGGLPQRQGGTAQGVRRAQPCDPQRGQGGPHRLQRGG